MKTKSFIRQAFDTGLIFLFFYGLIFNGFPLSTTKMVLFYLFIVIDKKEFIQSVLKNKMLLYCFWIWIIFTLHYLIMMVFTGNYYSVLLRSIFWFFSEGVLGAFMLYVYLIKRYDLMRILLMGFTAIFIQSIFVALSFVVVPFRDFVNAVLSITDERGFSSYRMKGFSNFGGASLSYLQMLGVIFGGVLFLSGWLSKKRKSLVMIGIFFITVIQIFIGRTGLVTSLFLMGVILIQQAINRGSLFSLLRQFLIAIASIVILFSILVNVIPDDLMNTFNDRVVNRSMEVIENYEESGQLNTTSTDNLKTMYFLPKSELGILFGEALWDENAGSREYYGRLVDSDVGYVRVIFAVGAIVGLIFYSIYIKYIRDIFRINMAKHLKILLWSLLIIFILGELKEPFLVRPSGIIKALFFLYFALVGSNYLDGRRTV